MIVHNSRNPLALRQTMESLQRGARWIAIPIVVVGVAVGVWYIASRSKASTAAEPAANSSRESHADASAVTVEVVHPETGGISRACEQPGTVEPFESADLYAKVSGYLVEQSIEVDGKMVPVDIGTPVKAGQVLAKIAVPEYQKEVLRDEAKLRDAKAKVRQMEAHKRGAIAEFRAADASIKLAKAQVKAKTAYRQYREKQLTRVKALVAEKALDAKLEDEQEDFYQSALENENAAQEQVNTSTEKAAAAKEKIAQAQADIDEATADVGVAEAILDHSRVLLEYTSITSPYDGVVTKRNFFPGKHGRTSVEGRFGDFIKSAEHGGIVPLFTVERIDVMRVVVQVPDRDVPYITTNSKAVVEIDALPGERFGADGNLTVSRFAKSEDKTTRTMKTEIDVDNKDGKLTSGMYGKVTINLTSGAKGAIRIPSVALVGKAGNGKGDVHVVRNGKVEVAHVTYDTDNGVHAEVLSGLKTTDQVIVRSSVPVEAGMNVTVLSAGH